jgi:type III secretory pathway component EscU
MTSIAMYFGGTSSVLDILQNHVNGWKEIFPNKSDYRLKEGVLKPVVLSILATSMLGLRQASYIRVPMFSLLQYVEY